MIHALECDFDTKMAKMVRRQADMISEGTFDSRGS